MSSNGRLNTPRPVCLVVDDEPSVLTAFKAILSDDYTLYLAGDGKTALSLFAEHPPHVVLLDLILPDMHGIGRSVGTCRMALEITRLEKIIKM